MPVLLDSILGFMPVAILAQLTGLVMVILMSIWTAHHLGGFAWQSNPELEFNWHPLLMTIGMIYLYGNAILIYRLFQNQDKKILKLVHAFLMICIFVLAVIGLKAVFDSHILAKPDPIPDLFSLHSWMGLVTVILFLAQWIIGLMTFLFPGLSLNIRSSYLPLHVFFGLAIFVSCCATALLGITEKAIFG